MFVFFSPEILESKNANIQIFDALYANTKTEVRRWGNYTITLDEKSIAFKHADHYSTTNEDEPFLHAVGFFCNHV